MADIRIDDRDLRLMLGAFEDVLGEDFDLTGNERQAYERLCKAIGRKPVPAYEQQSLGFLGDDEPPHPDEPRGRGIMGDYIDRTRHYFSGGSGMPWPPPRHEPPRPDRAKEIADRMARSASDAAHGRTPPPEPAPEKRPLTDEEKQALREALGESE